MDRNPGKSSVHKCQNLAVLDRTFHSIYQGPSLAWLRRLYCTVVRDCLRAMFRVRLTRFFHVFTRIVLAVFWICKPVSSRHRIPSFRTEIFRQRIYLHKTYEFTLWTFVTFIPFPLFIIVVCCMHTLVAPLCQTVASHTANGVSIDLFRVPLRRLPVSNWYCSSKLLERTEWPGHPWCRHRV